MVTNIKNDQKVGMQGDNVIVLHRTQMVFTREEAYRFAAYLVVMADLSDSPSPTFDEIKQAVEEL